MKSLRLLKVNEQRILGLLLQNEGLTFKEMAKEVGLNEVSVRRICNHLRQEKVFSSVNLPDFPSLGYNLLMVQLIDVSSPFLMGVRDMMKRLMAEWPNCLDCFETYDGKLVVRSVWRDAEHFKDSHAEFLRRFGTDWICSERIEMIPLVSGSSFIRITDLSG